MTFAKPEQCEQKADRDHDPHRLGGAFETPHHRRSISAPNSGATTKTTITSDGHGPPSPARVELPEGERGHHPERTLGEVEDARRRIGDHQPTCGDCVHPGNADAGDGERQELVDNGPPWLVSGYRQCVLLGSTFPVPKSPDLHDVREWNPSVALESFAFGSRRYPLALDLDQHRDSGQPRRGSVRRGAHHSSSW